MRHLLLALLLVMSTALPAGAATGLAFIPQTAGQRVTYHLMRTVQTTAGPQATTVTFSVVRRTGTTVVIERAAANGAPNLSILTAAPDGSLALSDPRTMSSDGDLTDVLYALNLAIAATREGDTTAAGTWLAVVPISAPAPAPAPRATTAPLVLVPSNLAGAAFDFSGSIQTTLPSETPQRGNVERGGQTRSSFPGGGGGGFPGGGGGFPGGGGGGRGGGQGGGGQGGGRNGDVNEGPGGDGRGQSAIAQTLKIDGHVTAGRVTRITISQQRTVIIAGQPYLNIGSWALTLAP